VIIYSDDPASFCKLPLKRLVYLVRMRPCASNTCSAAIGSSALDLIRHMMSYTSRAEPQCQQYSYVDTHCIDT
jgi:hypothetical protein